ncbi:MAG: hypothetical protein AAGA69_07350, partial [Pseudomonadota bacterium]
LHNALLKALEDNICTEDMPIIMPYRRVVSAPEFIEAVCERIGTVPSRLPIQRYGGGLVQHHRDAMKAKLKLV